MKTLQSILSRISTVKSIGILFVVSHLTLLTMMLFTFPKINAQIGTKAFDLQTFGYSHSLATTILSNLTEEVVDFYIFPQLLLLDVLYPIFLAFFLSSLLFRLIKLTNTKSKFVNLLVILPFIALFFDYAENLCIYLLITKSIPASEFIVQMSSSFTIFKSSFTIISWLIIFGLSILWIKLNTLGKN